MSNRFVSWAIAIAALAGPAFAQPATPPAPATPPVVTPAAPAAPAAAPIEGVVACGPIPALPTPPDISKERNPTKINAFTDKLNEYITAANANLNCRKAAIEVEKAKLVELQNSIRGAVDTFNAESGTVKAMIDKWTADVAAYEARQKPAPRR